MPPDSPEDNNLAWTGLKKKDNDHPLPPLSERDDTPSQEHGEEHRHTEDERTRLLRKRTTGEESYDDSSDGSLTPRPGLGPGYGSFADFSYTGKVRRTILGGIYPEGSAQPSPPADTMLGRGEEYVESVMGDSVTDGLLGHPKKHGTTHWLASLVGVRNERMMYVLDGSRIGPLPQVVDA
jgi:hypothetical protein